MGEYEINAVAILRRRGNYILLESEMAPDGVKTPDGIVETRVIEWETPK